MERIGKWFLTLFLPPLFLLLAIYIYYVLGIYAFHGGFDPPHPNDEELLATFDEQRPVLEELARMIREDKVLFVVDPTWTSPENVEDFGISAERIAEYREMLARIGPHTTIRSSDKGKTIRLIVNSRGSMFGGSSRGYYYDSEPPRGTLHDDGWYREVVAGDRIALKPIEDDWYLYDYAGGS